MGYPRYLRARAHKVINRTSGDYAVPVSANFATVDTALDLTLEAQVGDVIQYGLGFLGDYSSATPAGMALDIATVVSGSIVRYTGCGSISGNGYGGWYCPGALPTFPLNGSVRYTVQSGDLGGGLVTSRLVARATSNAKVIYANTNYVLQVWVTNLGPVDPH